MITLIITIAVAGLLVWAVTQIPMPPPFRTAIYVIAVVCLVLYMLRFFGVHHDIPLPR